MQAVFFDLQKAFDSVPHGPLIDKLIFLNVPTVLVSWISSYLYNRKTASGSVNVWPLLYVDGLSSIQQLVNGGSLVIFADDLLLHKVIYGAEDFLALQE